MFYTSKIPTKFSLVSPTFCQDLNPDDDQDQFTLRFNTKKLFYISEITAKFDLVSSNFLTGSGFYFEFQYQNYILYIKDTWHTPYVIRKVKKLKATCEERRKKRTQYRSMNKTNIRSEYIGRFVR